MKKHKHIWRVLYSITRPDIIRTVEKCEECRLERELVTTITLSEE